MQVKLYTKNAEAEKQGKKRKGSQADSPKDQGHSAKMRNFLANYWTEKTIVENFGLNVLTVLFRRILTLYLCVVLFLCKIFAKINYRAKTFSFVENYIT